MLVPGVPGLSENIRVTSVVDRFLEHTRIIYFRNGGSEEVYIASADWMPRNLDRRVELLVPVLQRNLKRRLYETLRTYLDDNTHAFTLRSDGSYRRRRPRSGTTKKRAQQRFHDIAASMSASAASTERLELRVRRSDPSQT
jgi:polyphosphate kinase